MPEVMTIEPGQLLFSPSLHPPIVRVICRYPFDGHGARARWVAEHINQPEHVASIEDEKSLHQRTLLGEIPLTTSLDGK